MPRAAFSQIVNRSMNEVLTRSLITGLSTVFLIGVLLIFGGETLRDFAFAMMVGVASGTYSSILIASPVLAHWKEREPAYRSRRARIIEAMGYVPTFPEENVVAKIDEAERHALPASEEDGAPPAADPPRVRARGAAAGSPAPPWRNRSLCRRRPSPQPAGRRRRAGGSGATATASERAAERERRKRRRQQRKRKHGRNR